MKSMLPKNHSRQGSTIIIVLATLLMMLVIGLAFMSAMRIDAKMSADAKDAKIVAAPEAAAVNYVGRILARDVINLFHPRQRNGHGGYVELNGWPDVNSQNFPDQTIESFDYPGYFDTWLSSIEPEIIRFDDNNATYTQWKHISRPDGVAFIDPLTMQPLIDRGLDANGVLIRYSDRRLYNTGNYSIQTAPLAFLPLPAADRKRGYTRNIRRVQDNTGHTIRANTGPAVDADGDGRIDSRWFELKTPAGNGLRWVMAMRIIDNSGMANLNVGTMFNRDTHDTVGSTPADTDLYALLYDPTGMVRYGAVSDPNANKNIQEFHNFLSLRAGQWKQGGSPFLTDFERETLWQYQSNPLRQTQVAGSALYNEISGHNSRGNGNFYHIGLDVEADLRRNGGLVAKPALRSSLDYILDAAGPSTSTLRTQGNGAYAPEGFYHSLSHTLLDGSVLNETNVNANALNWRVKDRRKHLTAFSGARLLRPRHLVDQSFGLTEAVNNHVPNYNELRYSFFQADINKIKMGTMLSNVIHDGSNTLLDQNGVVDPYDRYAGEHYARLFFDGFLNGINTKAVIPANASDPGLPYNQAYLDGPPLGMTYQDAADWSHALAANLIAYRQSSGAPILNGDPNAFNPNRATGVSTPLSGASTTHRSDQDVNSLYAIVRRHENVHTNSGNTSYYYGVKKQPFFKEALFFFVYQDDGDSEHDTPTPMDDGHIDPKKDREKIDIYGSGTTGSGANNKAVVVELGNPFNSPLDLSHYWIQINNQPPVRLIAYASLNNLAAKDRSIPAGGRVIIGPAVGAGGMTNLKVQKILDAIDKTPSHTLYLPILSKNTADIKDDGSEPLVMKLWYSTNATLRTNNINPQDFVEAQQWMMVDRMQAKQNLGTGLQTLALNKSNFTGIGDKRSKAGTPGNPRNFNTLIITRSLQRDDRHRNKEGFPRYIYENSVFNNIHQFGDAIAIYFPNDPLFIPGHRLGRLTMPNTINQTNYSSARFAPFQIITRNRNYDKSSPGRYSVNDGKLQSVAELGLLLTCATKYTYNQSTHLGTWKVLSESLGYNNKTTKTTSTNYIAHTNSLFKCRINPYRFLPLDHSPLKPSLPAGLNLFQQVTVIKPFRGNALVSGLVNINTASPTVLRALPYMNPRHMGNGYNHNLLIKKRSGASGEFIYDLVTGLTAYRDLVDITVLSRDLGNSGGGGGTSPRAAPLPLTTLTPGTSINTYGVYGKGKYIDDININYGTTGRGYVLYQYYLHHYNNLATPGNTSNLTLGQELVYAGHPTVSPSTVQKPRSGITDPVIGIRDRPDTLLPSRVLQGYGAINADKDLHEERADRGLVYPSEVLMVVNRSGNSDLHLRQFDTQSSITFFQSNRQDDSLAWTGPLQTRYIDPNNNADNRRVANDAYPYSSTRFDTEVPYATSSFDPIEDQTMVIWPSSTSNAVDLTSSNAGIKSFPLVDDVKELMLPYARMSNTVTTRSDVFTAYIVLQGREYAGQVNGVAVWKPVVTKRYIVTYDRSNVFNPGDMPRIIMKMQVKD